MPPGSANEVSVTASVSGISGYGGPLEYQYLPPDLPFMEFLGGLNGEMRNVCDAGRIRVSLFKADGALEAGYINLSAQYKAFQKGPSSRRSSLTVGSGTIVTVYGGGPITAVDAKNPNASVTQSFPIMSAELCKELSTFQARLGRFVAITPGLKAITPSCTGDCAAVKNTVIWLESERSSNTMVSVQGADTGDIVKAYRIDGVPLESLTKMVTANPFAIFRFKEGNSAEFLGPAVQIQKRGRSSSETVERITDACRISFTVPVSSRLSGKYAIMHLRSVGGRQAWIAENSVVMDRNGRVATISAGSTGIYALVRLSKETKQGRDAQ